MTLNNVGSVGMEPVYAGGERVSYEGTSAPAPAPMSPATDVFVAAAATNAEHAKAAAEADASAHSAEFQKTMDESIKQANKALVGYDRQIEREIHSVTKALMYKIRDTKTNEVIAEYPPKKIQDMIAKMWELAGLLIDQNA